MDATLKGRAAVVTGSTSGIGLGVATALARAGAKVMLNGFGEPKEIDALRRRLSRRAARPWPTTRPICRSRRRPPS